MKHLLFLALIGFTACSTEDPEPTKQATDLDYCERTIETNMHSKGKKLLIKAELLGCREFTVGFEARTTSSSYRSPSSCDVTEKEISFAYSGEILKVGLYTCGGNSMAESGKAYKLTINDGGVITVINSKVGNVNQYSVK